MYQFCILGFDVMIDKNFKPWSKCKSSPKRPLKGNINPSLTFYHNTHHKNLYFSPQSIQSYY